jgi:hypothetical protein
MESDASFEARVLEATGLALGDIPRGEANDLLGGCIFARREGTYVLAVGYPDGEDEDGAPVWGPSAFRRVDL